LHTFGVQNKKYLDMRVNLWSVLLLLASLNVVAQSSNVRWEYIHRYSEIAKTEMKRAGIPASIKLAQGILESGAGSSTLARKANNHFGMKCGSEWRGPTYYIKDDDYDENGQLIESCFRVYEDAQSSYIAHSEFLRDPNKAYRYGFLFRLDPTDYKKWAQGLKQSGYATSPTYADALIGLIDQYKLYIFDRNGELDEVRLINDVKMILARTGQTPEELASKFNVKTKCLLKYNEGLSGAKQPLEEGQYIFLQRKRWFFRGKQEFHYVKEGESMYDISKKYFFKFKRLYRKNRLSQGEEPAAGQKIRLRGRVKKGQSPKLREGKSEENDSPAVPLDNGSGKILDMDPTNVVKPSDLPNSNGSTSPNNGGTTAPNGNTTNGTKPTTTPSGNTTTSGSTTTNGNNTSGTKPTTTTSGTTTTNGTKTSTTTPNSTTPNNNGTKPTTTPSGTTSTTKPSTTPTTGGTTPSTTGGTKPTTPKPKPEPAGGIKPSPSVPSAAAVTHTVNAGETLYAISKLYGVSVEQLKTLNGLKDNSIKPGQVLKIKN
jgi:LysM repeat protein